MIDRVIAQHYGVPTQLMDWTIDPFIGLYFAVEGCNSPVDGSPRDGALFYIRSLRSLESSAQPELPYTDKLTVVHPPIVDERVASQKSVFTLQSFGDDGERFTPLDERTLEVGGPPRYPRDEVSAIGTIIIPSERKQKVLSQLLSLGIDSALLFPGLAGIGQRIAAVAEMTNYRTPRF